MNAPPTSEEHYYFIFYQDDHLEETYLGFVHFNELTIQSTKKVDPRTSVANAMSVAS